MTSSADSCQSIDTEIEPQDGNKEQRAMSKEISKKSKHYIYECGRNKTIAIDEGC